MISFRLGGAASLFLHLMINFAACTVCVLLKVPKLAMVPVIVLAAVAPYYVRCGEIQQVRHRFDQMLADHPLESLEARLEFEATAVGPKESESATETVEPLSTIVLRYLDGQEQRSDWQRQWALQQLHESFRFQFEAAAGFGFARMRRIRPGYFEPLPVDRVRLPMRVSDKFLGEVQSVGADKLHRSVSLDFLRRGKIGYVRDKQQVAGFQSHSLTSLTDEISKELTCDDSETVDSTWQLTRLELVSLLRHTPPRVYLADSLPAMDQLDQFEHRQLTEFERESLGRLQVEQDVVVQSKAGSMLMVGSLRASQDCLACHQGSKGKLLGAFSYEFVHVEEQHDTLDLARVGSRQE